MRIALSISLKLSTIFSMKLPVRLRHTNMAGIELARLAVMLSMRALKNGAGEGELSEEEVAAVGRIETPQEAERQYLLTQKRYREGAAVEVAKIKRD